MINKIPWALRSRIGIQLKATLFSLFTEKIRNVMLGRMVVYGRDNYDNRWGFLVKTD